MDSPATIVFSKPGSCLVLLFLFLIHSFPCALSHRETRLCGRRFQCGNITAGFPFSGGDRNIVCGHPLLNLQCNRDSNTTMLEISGFIYNVLQLDSKSNTLRLVREEKSESFSVCSGRFPNTTLPPELFERLPSYKDLSVFYRCDHKLHYLNNSECPWNGFGSVYQRSCHEALNVTVPVSFFSDKKSWSLTHLESVLKEGFEVKVTIDEGKCRNCSSSGGTCIFRNDVQLCCKEISSSGLECGLTNPSEAALSPGKRIGIGVACGLVGGLLIAGVVFCFIHRRRKKLSAPNTSRDLPIMHSSNQGTTNPATSMTISRRGQSVQSSNSNLGNGSVYFGVKVFSYEELEEATENFSKELGDGGFGVVYYGVLRDGREVAVKHLYERSLKRVEQFKNEIEILKSLKHPNLVILYGCTSRHSRELLLVYEYIPNGTLADHLHGDRSRARTLPWPVRLEIAIETASALSYLHASGIIHRDVKTTNILLDNNFQVKVADFGISRLFPTDATHVSTAPQGTPGYVDPEYYQCYRLNEKSDVYSFGVVLAELISSKEAVDVNRHRHDVNLANMAVSRVQNSALSELVDPDLGFERDFAVRRMVTATGELAFRCLQEEREVRPSMDEVVEVLRRIKNEENSEPAEVEIGGGGGGGDDVGLLSHGGAPPPMSPETDKRTNSSKSNTTESSF
ncbi:PREDICTED: LEAF RUST 10 DISEASE-RESISTANCE LOCUS RECEPTOR-LIKE PROTEIN KINASE-like 1.3 isoform X3 [Tarenaya hassleriana]|uniref:LEAF RUST 10 DISEASE-RESISTANCE LOCUS RECEPTOR-LIKE PROTEIN KINASE-like 1.3 isoform X3 n=1 Tax=Tarenaya hassleriana TaxID=28532 RepID=UPI00053C732E|nr:PREDICTED: LEAF RUST 10 DISEASE-RESISTANCE LOCUS RECEPTOR-LIKE PROTEIN KINASE-like 1.3 isoform X3 [Tarenaya hassleriana]